MIRPQRRRRAAYTDEPTEPAPKAAGIGHNSRELEIPEAFGFVYDPPFGEVAHRAGHGGRGSGKSHAFARAIILLCRKRRMRVGCLREKQNSLADSVKQLLVDQIEELGLGWFFKITDTEIKAKNGSRIVFKGLWANPQGIKSMEGFDLFWIEEAETVSQASIDLLLPTIRKAKAEVWWTWNPKRIDAPVDVMFRQGEPPKRSIVREINWGSNPFFPDALRDQMEWMRKRDPDKAAHVWDGGYEQNSEARVFKNWKVEAFETPDDAVFDFGADFGFATDPSVLVRQFMIGRTLFIDYEAYKVGCDIDFTAGLFAGDDPHASKDRPARWRNPWRNVDIGDHLDPPHEKWTGIPGAAKWQIRADSARPETISYLRRQGFNIVPATKGPGSVEEGVAFLQSCDIVIHPRCVNAIQEFRLYSYKVDENTDKVLPVLADKKNHIIDACRYGLELRRKAKPAALHAPMLVPLQPPVFIGE